jgi:ABC-type sugar transport system substrate-binding protein
MKRTAKMFSLLMIIALVAVLAACGGKKAEPAGSGSPAASSSNAGDGGTTKKLKVGFSQMETNNPWRIAETNSIKEEAAKRGIELVYTDAQSQTSKQVSDVEDMIAQKVDYILLAPREFEGLVPALEAAKAAKIPVILIDRAAKGVAGEDFVTLIASNFIEEGHRAGEWLVKEMNGKGNIVELLGTTGSSVAKDRADGFAQAIKASPDMKVISSQSGDFARANGQKVMENIIQAKGKEITAVYAHNDEMAIGAIQALKAAGMKPGVDVKIVSVDGSKDALKAIVAGELGATVECNPFFGPKAFEVIEKLEKGETVEPLIVNPDRFFDINNAEKMIDSAF